MYAYVYVYVCIYTHTMYFGNTYPTITSNFSQNLHTMRFPQLPAYSLLMDEI